MQALLFKKLSNGALSAHLINYLVVINDCDFDRCALTFYECQIVVGCVLICLNLCFFYFLNLPYTLTHNVLSLISSSRLLRYFSVGIHLK